MIKYINDLPIQFTEAIAIFNHSNVSDATLPYSNIVVCGLGGSGIAADLLNNLFAKNLSIPLIANKDYHLPHFINEKTLLILNSYSGNTEELINCFHEAVAKNLKPVCIACGGKLKELATANGLEFLELPTGRPPRSTIGYGAYLLSAILRKKGVLQFEDNLFLACQNFLEKNKTAINNDAIAITAILKDKIIIALSDVCISSVPLRFKQQINENRKVQCWHNVFSEFNHNELVAWKKNQSNFAVVLFETQMDNERNKLRFAFSKDAIVATAATFVTIPAMGEDFLQQAFYLIMLGDYISYHLGIANDEDTIEVNILTALKNHLAGH